MIFLSGYLRWHKSNLSLEQSMIVVESRDAMICVVCFQSCPHDFLSGYFCASGVEVLIILKPINPHDILW